MGGWNPGASEIGDPDLKGWGARFRLGCAPEGKIGNG